MPSWRLQQLHQKPHHGTGRVELAALPAGVIGELADQVFVGVPQDIAGAPTISVQVPVTQVQVAEVGEQAADDALPVGWAAQLGLVVPVRACHDAIQTSGVGLLDGTAGLVEGLAQVHRGAADLVPVGLLGHNKLVLVHVLDRNFPGHAGRHRQLDLLVETVREALEEQQREDVVLVVSGVDLPPQDVGGLPQSSLQFLSRECHQAS